MNQKRITPPPTEEEKKKDGPLPSRSMPQMPQIDLTKLDGILAENETAKGRKKKPPICCGILPCKGRTPFCFQCDLCMDCITGTGCSHTSSSHSYSSLGDLE